MGTTTCGARRSVISDQQAQHKLRWPRNVVQVESSLSNCGFFTALFLSYLWQYRHKSHIVLKLDSLAYIFVTDSASL